MNTIFNLYTMYQGNQNSSEEEISLLLSMVDLNILQQIFIQLVSQIKFYIYEEIEIKIAFTSLLNFTLTCKLFKNISKQKIFPLTVNNININLNYKKYLKIMFMKQKVETYDCYKEKDINNIFYQNCYRGYSDIINILIKYGANINHPQGRNQGTPLITATLSRNNKIIEKLIKYKNLKINKQDFYGCTALIYSSEDIVKLLISRKDINISLKNSDGETALDIAKENDHENIIQILENHDQNIIKEEEEISLLISILDVNILQQIFIQLVDQYKYFLNETDLKMKNTFIALLNFPLTCKIFENISKQKIFPLTLNNININLNYKKYLKILFIQQIIEKDIYCKEKDINNIFTETCYRGYSDIINILINYGANINHSQDFDQCTPLIVSSFHGNIKTVKKLIKNPKLKINKKDKYGSTALMYSCEIAEEKVVKLLISRKDINIYTINDAGLTALDKAMNHENIIQILTDFNQNLE